jgi:hypothetical protein
LVAIALAVGGCEKLPPAPPKTDTGAQQVAETFFAALVREDWIAAYQTLDPDSRARISKEQFVGRAQAAMKLIDFVPTEVNVAVSEAGKQASAIAVYRGVAGASSKQYRDGTALKRTERGWAVVLRHNFGKPAASAGRTVRSGKG